MKLAKTLALGALALALASAASAATYVKITGSTAFRKANIFAICNSLNSPKAAFAGSSGSGSTDISGQARVVIRGTLKSGPSAGQDVVFQLALAGSVGGVAAIDSDTGAIPGAAFAANKTWLKDDLNGNTLTPVTIGASSITGATFISDSTTAPFEAWSQPNAAFSDSLAGSTPYTSNPNVVEVAAGPVGVIDFYWVKGASNTANAAKYGLLTSITQQQAAALQKNGIVPLSQFTGNAADSDVDVVVVGRNSDSGTRLAAEAEAQLGFQSITPTLYRAISASGGITNDWTGFSEQGYDSGGKVATDLRTVFTGSGTLDENGKPFILVGYVGKSDKNTAINGGVAAVLNYNGVAPSDAAINNGQYSFWTFQHTYHRYVGSSVAVDALELQASRVISNDYAQSGISIGSMGAVTRAFEGAPVIQ